MRDPLIQADKRLRKTYGKSLAEYNAMAEVCGHVCEICGRPMKTRLNVDHFHFRIQTARTGSADKNRKWTAFVPELLGTTVHFADTKSKVIKLAKTEALPLSVRGLLDFGCNKGLRYFRDDPKALRRAADYLERFQQRAMT